MIELIEQLLASSTPFDEFIVGVPAKREEEFLAESLCALANHENGGYIFYGIGSRLGFVPFRKSQSRTEKIVRRIAESGLTPEVGVRFESCVYKGNPILAVVVEPALVRPVCIKDKTPLRVFNRVNGETYQLSRSEIGKLMLDTAEESVDTTFFSRPWSLAEVTSALSIQDIKNSLKLKDALSDSEVVAYLEQEGLMTITGTKFFVKKLAYLLFNSGFHLPFVQDEFRVPTTLVTTKEMEQKRLGSKRLYLTSLSRAVEQAMEYLNSQTSQYLKKHKGQQIVLPITSISEAIINAACFAEFNSIDRRKPFIRLELDGTSLWVQSQSYCSIGAERVFDKSGDCPNPNLRNWLRRLYPNSQYHSGKGLIAMLEELESLKLPPPEFKITDSCFDIKLFLEPITGFQDLSSSQRKLGCYQHSCLCASKHTMMTNRSLRQRLRADPSSYPRVSRVIAQAIRDKKLNRVGGGKSNKNAAYAPYWYRAATV